MCAPIRTVLDFFQLLDTMVQSGQHLVRSGRTLDYYHNIQDVCRQCLGAYRQAQGEQAKELAEIMGWAVRLMRYHRAMGTLPTERLAPTPTTPAVPRPRTGKEVAPQQDVKPTQVPSSPAVVPAKDLVTREVVTLLEDAKNRKAQVQTKDGEQVLCTEFPVYPAAKKSMRCRADITRRGGHAFRATFKRWE